MAFITYSKEEQAEGSPGRADLCEKKPIGFREDDGALNPYSNIFYWSHIWTEKGVGAEEYSHKGFEILTFVLKGAIEYYDSRYSGWKRLTAGDLQVIRSGNGFIHSERIMPSTSLIRIWTDPNLEKSLNQPASFDNYPSGIFSVTIEPMSSTKCYTGPGSPVSLQAEDIIIKEVSMASGLHNYHCRRDVFVSGLVLEGCLHIRKNRLTAGDFFIAKEEVGLQIKALSDCRLFIAESPLEPDYLTYAGNYRI